MLPGELLSHFYDNGQVVPRYLTIGPANLAIASAVIEQFRALQGKSQAQLDRMLAELEGEHPDYRVRRGLVHLLKNAFCTFERHSPLEPQTLRARAFALAAQSIPLPRQTQVTLRQLAGALSAELGREVFPDELQTALYADLPQNQILVRFDPPAPEALLHRYNLAQVQGVFYRATQVTLQVHRNDPGEYKNLFKYLKLFGLMTYIEGDPDHGFTLTIDGPTSLFRPNTHYGLALAKLLPALLHVTRWSLSATLVQRDPLTHKTRTGTFDLDSACSLVSHYPAGKPFDSMLEQSFAEQWRTHKTDWVLEREVNLLPIPGSVMIPDFRLVHPDGRSFVLELVGYWRPEYLRKKFAQVHKCGCENLILAVSERLNLEKAGVKLDGLPARIVWFKEKLLPRAVLAVLD